MRAFYETITPEQGASWAFLDRRLSDGIPFEWHHHPEYELTLTLNSRGYRYVGDDVARYDGGDLVLVGPGIPHSWCSDECVDGQHPHVALVCWFTHEWIAGMMTQFPEMAALRPLLAGAAQGLSFGAATRATVSPLIRRMPGETPRGRLILLLSVLDALSLDPEAELLANVPRDPDPGLVADPRMTRVLDHLHAHFARPICAEELAALACVSVSAFHRMFRRHSRTTMVDYLVRLRIGRACSLLIGTPSSIACIATDVGYTNLSLFNRQFLRLKGESPGAFRKRHRLLVGHVPAETPRRRA